MKITIVAAGPDHEVLTEYESPVVPTNGHVNVNGVKWPIQDVEWSPNEATVIVRKGF